MAQIGKHVKEVEEDAPIITHPLRMPAVTPEKVDVPQWIDPNKVPVLVPLKSNREEVILHG